MARTKPLWETDPIKFLIYRKLPRLELLDDEQRRISNPELESEYQELLVEQSKYLTELTALTADEIERLMTIQKDAFFSEYLTRVEAFDQSRFFSEPYSNADLDHWSKISFWTCDESVALSLGKDPRLVTWENIEEYTYQSGFVYVFAQRRELVRRAIEANQLAEKNAPSFFLAWAFRTRFFMPDQIVQAVMALGEQVADWKTEYDKLRTYLGEHTQRTEAEKATWEKESQEALEILAGLYSDLTELSQEHENLAAEANELRAFKAAYEAKNGSSQKPHGAREHASMLKLIYGMAVAFYGYDPGQSRNQAVTQIKSDLEAKGFKISDDTIRRYLDEAKQTFPQGKGGD